MEKQIRNKSRQDVKKSLREDILKKRDTLTPEEQEEKSRRILRLIVDWDIYQKSENLLCYVSCHSEVRTQELIRQALTEGKKVFCPGVCGRQMEFYRICSLQDLTPGFRDIPEPEKTADRSFPFEENGQRTLMLLPGVVFDRSHSRIGYGGGYYDRYLSGCGRLIQTGALHTAAAAYALQVVGTIPAEAHDIRVETVITENGLF